MEKVSSNVSNNNNLGSEESGVSQLGTPNATRICKYYAKNGVCKRYKSVCPFAHVDPKQKLDLEKFILSKEGKSSKPKGTWYLSWQSLAWMQRAHCSTHTTKYNIGKCDAKMLILPIM